MNSLGTIVLFACIPMLAAMIGGWLAYFYALTPKFMSTLQHFVAGVLVGAVSVELLPKILHQESNWSIGIGFVLGVAVMSLLHEFAHHLAGKEKKGMPLGLMAGGAIDFFIDGLLIGLSFIAGIRSGMVIAISLSLCAFFFSFAISAVMKRKNNSKKAQTLSIAAVALMFPLGALIGGGIIANLPKEILVETIAFGVAALLYVGVEELLVEAHETHDTVWVSSAFFLGFLLILLL